MRRLSSLGRAGEPARTFRSEEQQPTHSTITFSRTKKKSSGLSCHHLRLASSRSPTPICFILSSFASHPHLVFHLSIALLKPSSPAVSCLYCRPSHLSASLASRPSVPGLFARCLSPHPSLSPLPFILSVCRASLIPHPFVLFVTHCPSSRFIIVLPWSQLRLGRLASVFEPLLLVERMAACSEGVLVTSNECMPPYKYWRG